MRVEAVPNEVHAALGTAVELSSRAYNSQGHLVPPSPTLPVSWQMPPDGTIGLIGQDGPRARLDIVATAPGTSQVEVKMGNALATARFDLHGDGGAEFAPSAIADWLVLPHLAGTPPATAVVRAPREGGVTAEEHVSFAGLARLPNFTQPGSLLLLAPASRATHLTPAFTGGADTVHLTTSPPWQVPLRIWDATRSGLPLIHTDLAVANLVFRTNQTGLTFLLDGGGIERLPEAHGTEADCEAPETLFGDVFDPAIALLHVFYVESFAGGWRGYACPPSTSPGRVARAVFIARTRAATTLAHELGHLMGLLDPAGQHGHTHCQWGFEEDNLMWAFIDDSRESNRLRLSTGQVHRVVMDKRSWLATLGWSAATAPVACDVAGVHCPHLPMPRTATPPSSWNPPAWCGP